MVTQDGPIIFLSLRRMLIFPGRHHLHSQKYKNKVSASISLMNIPNCRILLWSLQESSYANREHLTLKSDRLLSTSTIRSRSLLFSQFKIMTEKCRYPIIILQTQIKGNRSQFLRFQVSNKEKVLAGTQKSICCNYYNRKDQKGINNVNFRTKEKRNNN
jgi:hypothetical protein